MKVVISKDAESDIQEIVDYSFHNFSQVTALEYIPSLSYRDRQKVTV